MRASSRARLNIDQDRNDESRNFENLEDGDLPKFRSNDHRQSHTHQLHNIAC